MVEDRRFTVIRDWLTSMRRRLLVMALVVALGATAGAFAQGVTPPATPSAKPSPTPHQDAAAGQPKPAAQPLVFDALFLARATLLTLNDANRSGNYTVLRDLAAPDFQAQNTAADLALHFSDLRNRKVDLFAVATLAPQFSPAPALDANRRLHLTGFFPTRPLQINFDLTFQVVNGQWRLLAISVATPPARATQSRVNPAPQHGVRPFYGIRILSGTAGVRW
jgi:hypothetical protein